MSYNIYGECPSLRKCADGTCIPSELICDGKIYCTLADDEFGCDFSVERATRANSNSMNNITVTSPLFYLLTIALPIAFLIILLLTLFYCYRFKRRRTQDVDRRTLLQAYEQQMVIADLLARDRTVVNIPRPLRSAQSNHRPLIQSASSMESGELVDQQPVSPDGSRTAAAISLLQTLLSDRSNRSTSVGRWDPYGVPLPQPLRLTDGSRGSEAAVRGHTAPDALANGSLRLARAQSNELASRNSSANAGSGSEGELSGVGALQTLIRDGPWVTLRTLRRAVPQQPYLPLFVEEARIRRTDNVNGPVYSLEPQLMLYHNGEFVWIPASDAPDMMGLAMLLTLASLQIDTGPPPASSATIDALPDTAITQEQADVGLRCNVCFDDFLVGESVRRLQCNHYYHSDCIVPWLQTNGTCPICRESVGASTEETTQQDAVHDDMSTDAVLL